MQAVEAEVEAFLAAHAELADEQGRRRLVRNGHAPERQIQTGIGPLGVRRPKLRDRGRAESGAPIRFTSAILPAYLRRTKNLEELLPWLYLKGVSTGQFGEALAALLGPGAPGLSASTVRRLTENWQEEHARWQRRDLSARRYVYLWADGVYFTPRLDHERWLADVVLIEDKGSGTALVQDLRAEGVVRPIAILPEADKRTRLFTQCAKIEAGHVLLPESVPWLDAFRRELLQFPHGRHDDQVDSVSQYLARSQRRYSFRVEDVIIVPREMSEWEFGPTHRY